MIKIEKTVWETWVYRWKNADDYDDMVTHRIEDWMMNEYDMDYFNDVKELENWVQIAMDDGTELIVVPAKEILDCPIKEGYFIY